MSGLNGKLEEYLAVRRAMGFKMERHEKLLAQYAAFLDGNTETVVTISNAVAWATLPAAGRTSRWHAQRLSMLRGFAAWLNAADPAHQVPPGRLIPNGGRGIVPYLYTDEEIAALAREAGRLSGRLRAATFQTLVRLLAVTGMRVGEAIRLDRGDYDPAAGVLTVRDTKFGKSRHLPLHPTAVTGLDGYARLRDEIMPAPPSPALLLTARGCRLRYERTWETFHALTVSAGLKPRSPACRPRIHDLRHSMAVATLLGWHRSGADVEAMMPRLSAYLGHSDPRHTYAYMSAAPELLALAAARLEDFQEEER
ncbi:MAG: tyrosine-type recombinase/integrase [Trebonia sp.]